MQRGLCSRQPNAKGQLRKLAFCVSSCRDVSPPLVAATLRPIRQVRSQAGESPTSLDREPLVRCRSHTFRRGPNRAQILLREIARTRLLGRHLCRQRRNRDASAKRPALACERAGARVYRPCRRHAVVASYASRASCGVPLGCFIVARGVSVSGRSVGCQEIQINGLRWRRAI